MVIFEGLLCYTREIVHCIINCCQCFLLSKYVLMIIKCLSSYQRHSPHTPFNTVDSFPSYPSTAHTNPRKAFFPCIFPLILDSTGKTKYVDLSWFYRNDFFSNKLRCSVAKSLSPSGAFSNCQKIVSIVDFCGHFA